MDTTSRSYRWVAVGALIAALALPLSARQIQAGLVNLATMVTGVTPIANGGSNKALTLAAGGIVWTDADSFEVGAAGTAGRIALSGGTGAPTWFAPTACSALFAGASGIAQEDNANFCWDDSNNYLGLGINVPLAPLHVFHSGVTYSSYTNVVGSAITAGVISRSNIDETSFAGATTSFRGIQVETNVNSASDTPSRTIQTISGLAFVPTTNSATLSNTTINSGAFVADYRGTGSIATVRGNAATGQIANTGSATLVSGFLATAQRTAAGTGNVTTFQALNGTLTNSAATGTITTAIGLGISNVTNASTMTDTYGIYVGDVTAGTQTNQAYSILTTDFGARNAFNGTEAYFAFTSAAAGGSVTLTTGNVPANGTEQHQTTIKVRGATDSVTDYFNPVVQLSAYNASATPTSKYLADAWGCEGTYTDASALGATSHCYLWDGVNSRGMLEFSIAPGSIDASLHVPDTGFSITGTADKSITPSTAKALTKNNSTTATYYGLYIKPTINTGGSNANTTVNLLDIDSLNTAVTGVTTNLATFRYGGTLKSAISSAGNIDAVTFSAAGDTGHTGTTCTAFTGGLCTTGAEPLLSPVALALLPQIHALEAELSALRAELAALKGTR